MCADLGPPGADPARRLRDALEPLAMHSTGSPSVREALTRLGLNRFQGYAWARAAVLEDHSTEAAIRAFAVFEPAMLRAVLGSAAAACPRHIVLRTQEQSTAHSLRATLGEHSADAVHEVAAALRAGALSATAQGRPLFSGLLALPWPVDPFGQLWRACCLLREHRGDTHAAVCARHGLEAVERNVLTELWLRRPVGRYTRTRGWSAEAVSDAVTRLQRIGLVDEGELTSSGRSLRRTIEAETNTGDDPIVKSLGERLEPIVTAIGVWSDQCIEAGAFTRDPFKRAAG